MPGLAERTSSTLLIVNSQPQPKKMETWIIYALLTVLSWGVYGVILHKARGQMPMGPETANAGLKAFLFVCVAYAIIGLIAALVLKARGTNWSFTGPDGSAIPVSLIAGAAGAVGAFTLVLALGAAAPIYKGAAAAAVMPIVFGGAPIINTLTAMWKERAHMDYSKISPLFIVGCVMAAVGAILVAKFAPTNMGTSTKPATTAAAKPH